jgi:hypothetical protein
VPTGRQVCISKGKEHKQYEFWNMSSFAYTEESGIIVGAMAIEGNIYDGRTLKPQLDKVMELTEGKIKKAIVDKGYKVKGGIPGIDIVMPKILKRESYYLKKKREERCWSRAGIEGLISHLKHDHRMIRNYLSGTARDQNNTLMASAAYNMKKWMRLRRQEILDYIFRWIYQTIILILVKIQRQRKNGKHELIKINYLIFLSSTLHPGELWQKGALSHIHTLYCVWKACSLVLR